MDSGNQHQMVVVQQHKDGSQEWLCPICGRHFIMQWPPNYKRVVLEAGDENAVHTGGSSGAGSGASSGASNSVLMGSVEYGEKGLAEPESTGEVYDPNSLNDPYLAPFERFMRASDL